jgi:hypothetical protein
LRNFLSQQGKIMKIVPAIVVVLLQLTVHPQAQQTQDSQDSSDTSGAAAAIQRLQQNTQSTAQLQQNSVVGARSCKEAVKYVESPEGLLGDWDRTMNQYLIYRDGTVNIQKVKDNLLSDTWWARSTGADVAIELNTFCKLFEDVMGTLTPSGEAIDVAKQASIDFGLKVKERSVEIYRIIKSREVNSTVNLSKFPASGTDAPLVNTIKDITDRLAADAIKEAFKRKGMGQVSALLSILQDAEEYARVKKESADFKATVQARVRQLDDLMYEYHNDMTLQLERLEADEKIKDAVISACNSTHATLQHAQSSYHSCNQDWSPKWDTTMNSESRNRLQQTFDQLASGCSQILKMTPEQISQQMQYMQTSSTASFGTQAWTSAQWAIYMQGWIEVCNCRQSSTQPAPVPITPVSTDTSPLLQSIEAASQAAQQAITATSKRKSAPTNSSGSSNSDCHPKPGDTICH